MIKNYLLLYSAIWGLVTACQQKGDNLSHITDPNVKNVLVKAFDAAGGLDDYQGLDSIVYHKRAVLYHADGSVERDQQQLHRYQLRPTLKGVITWADSLGTHEIIYDGENSRKTLNGKMVENSKLSAQRAFLSNHYVLMMPFKLADPGVKLSYEGTIDIDDREAEVIQATYAPDTHENHSTQDTWWYYFDQQTGAYLSSMVYHDPTYAYIENTLRQPVGALYQNLRRHSWRTDSLRQKRFLRAEFWYEGFVYPRCKP